MPRVDVVSGNLVEGILRRQQYWRAASEVSKLVGGGADRAGHKRRTDLSTKTNRENAQRIAKRVNKWLARAHRENPRFGARRLMVRARKILAGEQPAVRSKKALRDQAKKRGEITEYRARQYLETARKDKKTGDV